MQKLDLKEIHEEFQAYIDYCLRAISSLNEIEKDDKVFSKRKKNQKTVDNYNIVEQRKKLIQVKVEHTKRVVDNILILASKIGVNEDLLGILECVAFVHDIGRFEYAVWNDYFGETGYLNQKDRRKNFTGEFIEFGKELPVKSHAEAGEYLLRNRKVIKSLSNQPEYLKIIAPAVLHHQDAILSGKFSQKYTLINVAVANIITSSAELNSEETKICALATKLVKDADCLDILYQYLTLEIPVLRLSTRFNKNIKDALGNVILKNSLEEFANYWGFTPEYVAEYNGLTLEEAEKKDILALPVYDEKTKKLFISPEKLVMPTDLQEKFFNLERLDLQELLRRFDYNPIITIWWRLLQFLGTINFNASLELVKERNLLDKIFNLYPDELKPNVIKAFDFAKEHLIENRGSGLYANSILKK